MKRTIILALVLGLIVGAVGAADAKKKKAKPVATTLFMEGTSALGEEDQYANSQNMKLQPEEGSGEKSRGFWGAATSPNPDCAANLHLPVFVGNLQGTVTGDLKITFDAMSTPGNAVEIRVWPDISSQICNEAYIPPAGAVTVDLPAGSGTVEATIENLNFVSQGLLTIQINPVGIPPGYARVLYGTPTSKVEFSCIPAGGAKSCIP